MATISGTATKLSDSTAVVGGKITLINSDTDEVAVNTSDVKCVTTTGALGAFEFLDVPDGITVHVVGEWDDGGTLYNAKSQPFISTGTAGDPGALMTKYNVAADSVWIKADEDPTTFTTRDAAGTLHITAWGSKSPAGISGTAPDTESRQPVLADGLVKFVKADSQYLIIPSPFGTSFNPEGATYTVSVAIPVWGNQDNSWLLSNRAIAGGRFNVGQIAGALSIRATGTVIASYDPRPAYVIATWRVNNGTTVTDGEFRAHLNTEEVTGGVFTPTEFHAGAVAMEIGRVLSASSFAQMDLAELVLMPGAYLDDQDLEDLHNRMLTLYQPA